MDAEAQGVSIAPKNYSRYLFAFRVRSLLSEVKELRLRIVGRASHQNLVSWPDI